MRPTLIALVLLTAVGCATVPLAPPEVDAAAKRFDPPPEGLTRVYVYRASQFYADGVEMLVDVGQAEGAISPRHYIVTDVEPGPVLVRGTTGATSGMKRLDVGEGSTVYVRANVGLVRVYFGEVSDEKGRAAIRLREMSWSTRIPEMRPGVPIPVVSDEDDEDDED